MAFRPEIAANLTLMDLRIFAPERLQLNQKSLMSLEKRFVYDAEQNVIFFNFEGFRIDSTDDLKALRAYLEPLLQSLGRKVKAIINYDHFELNPILEQEFMELVRYNQQHYFESSTRYSTQAFFRRQLGRRFAALDAPMYPGYAEARQALE